MNGLNWPPSSTGISSMSSSCKLVFKSRSQCIRRMECNQPLVRFKPQGILLIWWLSLGGSWFHMLFTLIWRKIPSLIFLKCDRMFFHKTSRVILKIQLCQQHMNAMRSQQNSLIVQFEFCSLAFCVLSTELAKAGTYRSRCQPTACACINWWSGIITAEC